MIVIVDYGMGNLGSVLNMLKYLKIDTKISNDPSVIEKAEKIILPGVGSFDNGMKNLETKGLKKVLDKRVLKDKVPILGVCLGMQLMTKKSEEGNLPGLGWIDANTVKFKFKDGNKKLKIPHMGWNTINIETKKELFQGMSKEPQFYFVHSYHVVCKDKRNILSTTIYGYEFASSIQRENIMGVQFHPEKSHKFGMKVYQNFAEMK